MFTQSERETTLNTLACEVFLWNRRVIHEGVKVVQHAVDDLKRPPAMFDHSLYAFVSVMMIIARSSLKQMTKIVILHVMMIFFLRILF